MKGIDKKAQQILFKTYWLSSGWNSKSSVSSKDFEYALNAGYMFKPVSFSHDEIVENLINIVRNIEIHQVSSAFLASLSSRRLELRSALGSFAFARNFPDHKFVGDFRCDICGEYLKDKNIDLNVLNFERLKWGGVRHLSAVYAAFDLEQFTETEVIEPNKQDFEIFKTILDLARSVSDVAKPSDLEKLISNLLPSNKDERRVLIEILGFCGILQPQHQKGFLNSFVNDNERQERPGAKNDWDYPICWWRGKDGVNELALSAFFPHLIKVM
jgi:hypothetical protein